MNKNKNKNKNKGKASQCSETLENKTRMDCIDRQVLKLLGERYGFVGAASQFDNLSDKVEARPLFNVMLKERIARAEELGSSVELMEKIRSELIDWFVAEEMKNGKSPSIDYFSL